MALVWKTRTMRLDESEEGSSNWEPFAVVHDDDGTPLVVCKGLFDVETGNKSTEIGGGLGDKW